MTWALGSLKNFHFNRLLLSKVYIVWAKKWDLFSQSRKCMTLKFTEELYVMKMKNDTKIEEELTCCFKTDMSNLSNTNFDLSTRKSKKFVLNGSLWQNCLSYRSTEELSFRPLKRCGLKKDLRNLTNFHRSTWKCQNWDIDRILLSKVEKVWP